MSLPLVMGMARTLVDTLVPVGRFWTGTMFGDIQCLDVGPWLQAESKVATILGIFPLVVVVLLLLLTAVIQNTRRGSRKVSKFCMGS